MSKACVLIMAGGTGGHVYPALAVAEYLRTNNICVHWLGTEKGLEARVVPSKNFPIHFITSVGVRGKGLLNAFYAPLLITKGLLEAIAVLKKIKPVAVLGMGGFVSVPGALACVLMRKPLVIHEQNAMAGTANRVLSRIASMCLQGFDGALPKAKTVGNPVRAEIVALHEKRKNFATNDEIHLLVLGGSLGAKAINDVLPLVLKQLLPASKVCVWHQTGKTTYEATVTLYEKEEIKIDGVRVRVSEYIEDMAGAYQWADIILCRAGAMTLAEITCAGLPALLVPLPNAIDDHQNKNAQALVNKKAAMLLPQHKLTTDYLLNMLTAVLVDNARLEAMSIASKQLAPVDAAEQVANICLQLGGAH